MPDSGTTAAMRARDDRLDRYRSGPDTAQEDRRIARVLNLLARLNAEPQQWTRRRLAAHYGVSERTITKDLSVLEHALDIAIAHDRGGYYLDEPLPLPPPRDHGGTPAGLPPADR